MHNDGLDFCLPKNVCALRTITFSTLHHVVNEFDDSPSSITSASLAFLSRQTVHPPWKRINCTPPWLRKCLSSFCTSVYISRTTSFASFLFATSPVVRNFCVIHHSWLNTLMVFGSHEYRPIDRFEASAVKAMRLILTCEFFFQLILRFCTLTRPQHWKYNVPIRCSHFFTVTFITVSKQTYLKMSVLNYIFSTYVIQES